jgi:hypothetical protein
MASPSGLIYATHPFFDHAIFLQRVNEALNDNLRSSNILLATAACTQFIQAPSEAFHRRGGVDRL